MFPFGSQRQPVSFAHTGLQTRTGRGTEEEAGQRPPVEEVQEMDEERRAGAADLRGRLGAAGALLCRTSAMVSSSQLSYFPAVSTALLQQLNVPEYLIKQ